MIAAMLGTKKATNLVAVEMADGHVTMLCGSGTGGAVSFHRIYEQRFTEDDELSMAAFIAECFKELKIKNRQALCVAPAKQFITKNVDIPSNDKEEIGKIVDLQAGRLTPYSRDEIIIDYLSMEIPGQYYTNVLLTILNRKVAEKFARIFELAGVEMERLVITSEGVALAYDRIANQASEESGIAGIQINDDSSELIVVDMHQMVFVRVIPVGSKHFDENKENAQNEFMIELNKSIIAYQNLGVGRPIKEIVLTGMTEDLDFLEQALRDSVPYIFAANLPIRTVSYKDYYAINEEVSEILKDAKHSSYFNLMACLVEKSGIQIDMVPKETKIKREVRENTKQYFSLTLWIFAGVMMILLYLGLERQIKEANISKLTAIQEQSFKEARKLELISNKSSVLRNTLENRGRGLYAFERISSFIGSDIVLTGFSYNNEKSFVKFAGTADSMSRVFAFVTELEESNYFSSVNTSKTKSRRQGQKDVADFEIECHLAEGF